MKIYLVSVIYAYPDERMSKRFEAFKDKDSAKKYFDEFKQIVIDDLLELEGFEDVDELFNYYEENDDSCSLRSGAGSGCRCFCSNEEAGSA